jgi:hypothetical protein
MGRWHRKPKKINLKPLIRESGCTFVLDSRFFVKKHLELIREACETVVTPERIQTEFSGIDRSQSVLIVAAAPEDTVDAAILRDGWRGVVVVDAQHGIRPVVSFLTDRTHYKLTHLSWAERPDGEVPPFVLSMNVLPAHIEFSNVQADFRIHRAVSPYDSEAKDLI